METLPSLTTAATLVATSNVNNNKGWYSVGWLGWYSVYKN